jgi:acyl carrier protein
MIQATPVAPTEEQILGEVVEMLVDVIGEDFLLDVEVSADTSFSDDLAVESIEFVALAERLRERYGDKVDFVAFVGELELEEILSMTVGRLVDHIRQCLRAEPAERAEGGNDG